MYKNKCSAEKSKNYSSDLKISLLIMGILIGFFICFIIGVLIHNQDRTNEHVKSLELQIKDLKTKYDSSGRKIQLQEIKDYIQQINLQNADIVYAQILLETGYLTSSLYFTNNNLFGMKVAKQRPTSNINPKGYAKYNTWQESVLDYALWQTKYAHNLSQTEYLQFLAKYYAEDKEYINKLKSLIQK